MVKVSNNNTAIHTPNSQNFAKKAPAGVRRLAHSSSNAAKNRGIVPNRRALLRERKFKVLNNAGKIGALRSGIPTQKGFSDARVGDFGFKSISGRKI